MRRVAAEGEVVQTGTVRAVLWLLPLVAALALTGAAAADGDPASDVLVAGSVFTPYPPPPPAAIRALDAAVDAVDLKGDRVKVAVIATASDLGSVPGLYNHPQEYAKFLSLELSFIYNGPLLVVMPGGFGFVDKTLPVSEAAPVLASVSVHGSSSEELTLGAARAVTSLEHAGRLHYKDTYAPQAYPAPASVVGGRRLALRYQVWDDSGRASVEIEVQNARNITTAHFHVPIRRVAQGAWYFVVWRAPATLSHHVVAFCVQASDVAGNRSHRSCAKLTVT
jgi:hypothetical protein